MELTDSTSDPGAFSAALEAARNADSANGWAVTPKTADDIVNGNLKTYMSADGSTGFAIAPDGDIEAVFANKQAGAPRHVTRSTIPQAIALGGTKLDCYGERLANYYAGNYGLIPVARVEFNAEYANEGWTADKGEPYVYFMIHNGDSADTIVEKMGTYRQYTPEEQKRYGRMASAMRSCARIFIFDKSRPLRRCQRLRLRCSRRNNRLSRTDQPMRSAEILY